MPHENATPTAMLNGATFPTDEQIQQLRDEKLAGEVRASLQSAQSPLWKEFFLALLRPCAIAPNRTVFLRRADDDGLILIATAEAPTSCMHTALRIEEVQSLNYPDDSNDKPEANMVQGRTTK